MFTGIIESMGVVTEVLPGPGKRSFWVRSAISSQLKVDQSLSHNGVCLTVEELSNDTHRVTAIDETLKKTTIGSWETGTSINLERSLLPTSRLDGHLVQGHVDATATCTKVIELAGSREYVFRFPGKFAALVIEKGSICINGISLTCFDVKKKTFRVAIIPFTLEHTNMKDLKKGDQVNIEFDLIGKYILRTQTLSDN